MGKKLIIAEKSSLAEKIAKAIDSKIKKRGLYYENDEVVITNVVGHVLESTLPDNGKWDIDNLPYQFDNLPLRVKTIDVAKSKDKAKAKSMNANMKKLVENLLNSMNRTDVDEIVSAGDPDAEGSLLIQELYDYSKIDQKRKDLTFSRMWILSYDKEAIRKSYAERYDQKKDKPWSDAARARSYADLYVGYNFSPLFSILNQKYGKDSFSIGRVMTPTLNLVRKRELDIENFISKQYFLINGEFNKGDINFNSKFLCKENNFNEKIPADNIEGAEQKLDVKTFKVIENKTKPKKTLPSYLPNMNDVLKSMSKKYKYAAKKITDDMQVLYENDFISYPRSEERFLPPDMAGVFEEIFNNFNNFDLYSDCNATFQATSKRIFDKEKSAPHYAISPLSVSQDKIEGLTTSQKNIFNFVVGQFMMAFMPAYEYEETIILLENEKEARFRIAGKIEKNKGFKKFQEKISSSKSKKKEVILPDVSEGDTVELTSYKKEEKWTEPPKLLTEDELLGYMENINKVYVAEQEEDEENDEDIFKEKFSLGTPATRGPTIDKLYEKQFMFLNKDKRLETFDKSKEMLKVLEGKMTVALTAQFEKDMAAITTGQKEHTAFEKDIKEFVDKTINEERKGYVKPVKYTAEKTGEQCPKCGKDLVKRKTKTGDEFVACSGFPNCKYALFQVNLSGNKCAKCGKDMILKKSKDGKEFEACSGYPNCKYTTPKGGFQMKKTGEKCPQCGKDLIIRKKKDGGEFVACSGYPECKFAKSLD